MIKINLVFSLFILSMVGCTHMYQNTNEKPFDSREYYRKAVSMNEYGSAQLLDIYQYSPVVIELQKHKSIHDIQLLPHNGVLVAGVKLDPFQRANSADVIQNIRTALAKLDDEKNIHVMTNPSQFRKVKELAFIKGNSSVTEEWTEQWNNLLQRNEINVNYNIDN
jgi:hypothetical protein